SLIAALFQQPLHLAVDQPESGLFHQWQLPAPTTDVVEVDVDDQQLLTALVRGGHDVAPGIDHVGTAPETQVVLHPDPVDEHHEQLAHTPVEAGDATPVTLRVVPLRGHALRTGD